MQHLTQPVDRTLGHGPVHELDFALAGRAMSTETLTDAQLDGLACITCGTSHAIPGAVSRPVGSRSRGQVFVCSDGFGCSAVPAAGTSEWLTEKATDAKGVAFDRYPRDRSARIADEAAQLRLLVEQAAEYLRIFERERERYVEKIAHLTAKTEVLEAVGAQAERNYMQRLGQLALKAQGATNA